MLVAINRVGAVAVMLRPDGTSPPARAELLGRCGRIIADPERAALAAGKGSVHTFVLGGGGGAPATLASRRPSDIEQIDPPRSRSRGGTAPIPGALRPRFILFTGEGEHADDPHHQPPLGDGGLRDGIVRRPLECRHRLQHDAALSLLGLMMCIGGAIVGGSRPRDGDELRAVDVLGGDAPLRRHGRVVHVDHAARALAAPEQPGERHHSVRLFIGSGMPPALWRRVQKRFRPARVLECYASIEAGVILVNVSGAKLGAMVAAAGDGRGRLAGYDATAGEYVLGRDGFVTQCGPGEIGVLLARVGSGEEATTALRGVFERGDASLELGDLFRRDADGDYWRVDGLGDVIHAEGGPVFTGPIREALGTLPAVDLAVIYGVVPSGSRIPVAIAAVTVRPDAILTPRDLAAALRKLRSQERPQIVHIVDRIPVTTWYRPATAPLRLAGIPEPATACTPGSSTPPGPITPVH